MRIEYQHSGQDDDGNSIKIKDQGWRVYAPVRQKTRRGKKVRRKVQVVRWKLVEVFDTELEAIAFVDSEA